MQYWLGKKKKKFRLWYASVIESTLSIIIMMLHYKKDLNDISHCSGNVEYLPT